MTDSYSIGKRLKEYIRAKKLKQNTVAQRVDVTPGFISQIVNGEEAITSKVIAGLVKSFADLNINWLLRGEGEMFLEKTLPAPGVLTGVMEPEPVYEKGRGEGRLEYLERKVEEMGARIARLEEELREVVRGNLNKE